MITPLRPGLVLMIYQDPVTKLKPEGKARLLELIQADDEMPRWLVRFEGDDLPVERKIHTPL